MNKTTIIILLAILIPFLASAFICWNPEASTAEVEIIELSDNQTEVTVIPDQIDPCDSAMDIGSLFMLDHLFEGSDLLKQDETELRDLIIIDSLFNNRCVFNNPKINYDLSDLMVLEKLFNNASESLLSEESGSLENLIILNQLFNGR